MSGGADSLRSKPQLAFDLIRRSLKRRPPSDLDCSAQPLSGPNRSIGKSLMALNIYYDKDADLGRIQSKKVAVIGYGSQGHAHAQNLHASGVDVVVGLRKDSSSWTKVEGAGLKVATVADATREADLIMLTVPD